MINLSRMRYRIAAASSVVALSFGALVAATSAQAQVIQPAAVPVKPDSAHLPALSSPEAQPDAITDCPANRLCLFSGQGYTGTVWHFGDDPRDNTWVFVGSGVNDKARSVFNNRTNWATVNKDFNPTSPDNWLCLSPGFHSGDLTLEFWGGDGTQVDKSISAYILSKVPNTCFI